jgi:thiol:disulfide interchange protein DsbD
VQSTGNLLSQGYLFAFVTVFVGGFLTSLTPCVYPLISITVSLFGARDQQVTRGRAILLASSYVAGIAVTYTSLGVGFALTGRALGFGTFMTNPWVIVPLAIVFIAMAASMFGAFELNLPPSLATRLSAVGGKGFGGAFLMGLVGGIIAAPCTGPVLASVLAYVATTRSVALGGGLLFTYAMGMGVLFFTVAAFASALPKSGAWMESVKSVFGVVMVVAALYFLRNVWRPLASYGSSSSWFIAAHLAAVAMGVVLGGLKLSFHGGAVEKLRKGLAVAVMVTGVFGVVASLLAPRAAEAGTPTLAWIKGEPAGVAAARSAGRPALLDFYADWCLPCKELEKKTFDHPEVARELGRFTLVKVDCSSDEDPQVVETQKRYQAATLPTVVLIDSLGRIVRKIDHVIEPAELLDILRAIR